MFNFAYTSMNPKTFVLVFIFAIVMGKYGGAIRRFAIRRYNPMGLYRNFRTAMGVIHHGGYTRKFFNAFLCTKRCPWANEGRNGSAKKFSFYIFSQKWGLYTRGLYNKGVIHLEGYTPRVVIQQALP